MEEVRSVWYKVDSNGDAAANLTALAISTRTPIETINNIFNSTDTWSDRTGALLTASYLAANLSTDVNFKLTPVVYITYIYNGKTMIPIVNIRYHSSLEVKAD